jgi:heterodisulfide reductase subunit A-like polyferredoxin
MGGFSFCVIFPEFSAAAAVVAAAAAVSSRRRRHNCFRVDASDLDVRCARGTSLCLFRWHSGDEAAAERTALALRRCGVVGAAVLGAADR